MKIAILSDIHGNIPALEAVLDDLLRDPPDMYVVNGDVINRGPDSATTLQMLGDQLPDAIYTKGNHETWVLRCRDEPIPRRGARFETQQFAYWTLDQLGDRLAEIDGWHDNLDLELEAGSAIHFTHGSRLGNRDGIHPRIPDTELPAKLGEKRDLFIASHTHVPMVKEFQGTLVVNSGSIGSPFDRDPRASYARLSLTREGWNANIIRIPYDRLATERLYQDSGFLDQAGPLPRLMLRELQLSRGLMGIWMRTWQAAVLEGSITLEDSVEHILANEV
jgi:putative phosphoesterase